MKKLSLLFLVILLFFAGGFAQQTISNETYSEQIKPLTVERRIVGKVVRVADGDTITVLSADKQQYKIRFEGIDAPESKQDFGQTSKKHLSDLVYEKEVTVITSKIDKYGRFVGKVIVNGVDANLEQIKAGLAWHYKKYADEQNETDRILYAEEEKKARNAKVGLWEMPEPTPPWAWRAGQDNANLEGVPEGSIVGNKNSKIYHTPGCSTYAKVSAKNRTIFATTAEAEKAGYRIAKNCSSGSSSGSTETTSKPEVKEPPQPAPKKADSSGRTYIRGSRGGCYYINGSGKKTYVDRTLCN